MEPSISVFLATQKRTFLFLCEKGPIICPVSGISIHININDSVYVSGESTIISGVTGLEVAVQGTQEPL